MAPKFDICAVVTLKSVWMRWSAVLRNAGTPLLVAVAWDAVVAPPKRLAVAPFKLAPVEIGLIVMTVRLCYSGLVDLQYAENIYFGGAINLEKRPKRDASLVASPATTICNLASSTRFATRPANTATCAVGRMRACVAGALDGAAQELVQVVAGLNVPEASAIDYRSAAQPNLVNALCAAALPKSVRSARQRAPASDTD